MILAGDDAEPTPDPDVEEGFGPVATNLLNELLNSFKGLGANPARSKFDCMLHNT